MNCDRAHNLMHDELDGVLSSADSDRLMEHLATCETCQTVHAQLTEIAGGFGDLRTLSELPERASRSMTFRMARLTRVAAVIAFVIGGALIVRTALQTDDLTPDQPVAMAVRIPTVVLAAESADRYIAVMAETDDPHVHIVWLHTAVGAADDDKIQPSSNMAPMRRAPALVSMISVVTPKG